MKLRVKRKTGTVFFFKCIIKLKLLFFVPMIFINIPLIVNPNRAMLITINDKWFHCVIEKRRINNTSNERVEKETIKMIILLIIKMFKLLQSPACHRYKAYACNLLNYKIIALLYYKHKGLPHVTVRVSERQNHSSSFF